MLKRQANLSTPSRNLRRHMSRWPGQRRLCSLQITGIQTLKHEERQMKDKGLQMFSLPCKSSEYTQSNMIQIQTVLYTRCPSQSKRKLKRCSPRICWITKYIQSPITAHFQIWAKASDFKLNIQNIQYWPESTWFGTVSTILTYSDRCLPLVLQPGKQSQSCPFPLCWMHE